MFTKTLIGAATGFFPAVLVDLHSFATARAKDPKATFDWGLALTRWGIGLISGAMAGLGIAQVA